MTWRRFCALLQGLSSTSWWFMFLRADADKPKQLSGKAVDSYFATL
jgi:hypothetical protein